MPNPPEGMHPCPTRADGAPVLFAHMITLATCQNRQRAHYHKCPTCVHENSRAKGPHAVPALERSADSRPPTPVSGAPEKPPKTSAKSKASSVSAR